MIWNKNRPKGLSIDDVMVLLGKGLMISWRHNKKRDDGVGGQNCVTLLIDRGSQTPFFTFQKLFIQLLRPHKKAIL